MRYTTALLGLFVGLAWSPIAHAQHSPSDTETFEALQEATGRIGDHKYTLRYKYRAGESIAYEVEHLVRVKTTIDGVSQTQQSRSTSQKVWEISDVSQSEAVITHSISYLNMWSESQGRAPVKYDSRKDDKPPAEYENVADMVGKPLTRVRVNALGKTLDRKDQVKQFDLGTGGLLMPLPPKAVAIGESWAVARDVPARQEDGTFKAIKTRQRYQLERVESGVATISLKTQILTPSISARVRSQLIQKLSNGEIRFDIDAGRVISRQLEWDESVVGFNGPKSNMSYLGRISEKNVPTERVAKK
jgi:hypothetical protein